MTLPRPSWLWRGIARMVNAHLLCVLTMRMFYAYQ